MTRAIEHDDGELIDLASQAAGDGAKVFADRRVDIDQVFRGRADDQLLHVEIGRVQQAALFRRGEHRNRIRRAGRAQVRAFERIDGDVHLVPLAPVRIVFLGLADLLADVQHRRFVALALADDDRAVDWNGVHLATHRLDGHLVGLVPVALPHRVRAGNGCLLDHAQEVEREMGLEIALVLRVGRQLLRRYRQSVTPG